MTYVVTKAFSNFLLFLWVMCNAARRKCRTLFFELDAALPIRKKYLVLATRVAGFSESLVKVIAFKVIALKEKRIMMNLFAWVMFVGVALAVFFQAYAWACFIAFALLMLFLRDINGNLCEIVVELKNNIIRND